MSFKIEELLDALGQTSHFLMNQQPFKSWNFEDVTDEDIQLPGDGPTFSCQERGIELSCDDENRIRTIFLHVDQLDQSFIDLALTSDRSAIRQRFGVPERSGEAHTSTYLGDYGPFDRFALQKGIIHFQFKVDADRLQLVTLMRHDTAL